ncbi:MAG: carbon-nitrogen hydrolase family protein [Acidovorax sp.]|nr:carbon-nitrogen hydrolase family protein [Acidovorax sp.]
MNPFFSRPLLIAAAQITVVAHDVARNAQTHLAFVRAAAHEGVQLLVFPELSLTGYELPQLAAHVVHAEHPLLAPLHQAARDHGMTLVVGAPAPPARAGGLPAIGAWVLNADGSVALYRKRHLHGSEVQFASAGVEDALVLPLADTPTALAICADATHPEHANAAATAGAALYATGALISEQGYGPESAQLQAYARDHAMAVLLSNHGGPSGGYVSAGRSAFWAPGGALVVAAPGAGDWLVLAQRDREGAWSGRVAPVDAAA